MISVIGDGQQTKCYQNTTHMYTMLGKHSGTWGGSWKLGQSNNNKINADVASVMVFDAAIPIEDLEQMHKHSPSGLNDPDQGLWGTFDDGIPEDSWSDSASYSPPPPLGVVTLDTTVQEYPPVDLWPIMENGYGDGSQSHPDATANNNGGHDPFGPTFTDLHSLGQNGTMWGIYYSQGGMANVSGETYGNGTYEFRADRNTNGQNNTIGKVFWRKNYWSGSSDGSFGYYTNFNRNSDGTYDDNPNDSTFPTLGYAKDGYLGTWAWIMLPTQIYLTGITLCESWKYNQNFKDFRIYGRRSIDSMPNYDTSTQANRVYLTEKADDWVLVYEHKEEFDGEPNYFQNPGNIISDPQNAGSSDTHTTFDKADVCHGHRIDFRKGGV